MNIPTFVKVNYSDLSARQQENYNFHTTAALLAKYGYTSLRLTDDWNGADFIAIHNDGSYLKVQLKGRMYLSKRYVGKELWIAFWDHKNGSFFLFPHDTVLKKVLANTGIARTKSWSKVDGAYGWKTLSPGIEKLIDQYKLSM